MTATGSHSSVSVHNSQEKNPKIDGRTKKKNPFNIKKWLYLKTIYMKESHTSSPQILFPLKYLTDKNKSMEL